jgi:hypothetical protein
VEALRGRLKTLTFSPDESAERNVQRYLRTISGSAEFRDLKSLHGGGFDVSVATSDADLSSITKRAALIASELIVSHTPTGRMTPLPDSYQEPGPLTDWSEFWQKIDCPSVTRLGEWLSDVAPLIRAGRLIYYPHANEEEYNVDAGRQEPEWTDIYRHDLLMDVVMRDGKAITSRKDATIGSRIFIPLLQVDLPYIEGTSLRDFADFVTEEWGSWEAARDFLRTRLLDLLSLSDEEELKVAAARLSVELSEGVRETHQDLTRISRRSAVQAAGGVLATAAATLVAVNGAAFGHVVQILGAAGGAWSLASAYSQHNEETAKARTRPYYLLWLLSKQ